MADCSSVVSRGEAFLAGVWDGPTVGRALNANGPERRGASG